MITRNQIFDFIDDLIITPIVIYLEDKSLNYEIGSKKNDRYWNLAHKIMDWYIWFELDHGYVVKQEPIPEWLRDCIMIDQGLTETDLDSIHNYWIKG